MMRKPNNLLLFLLALVFLAGATGAKGQQKLIYYWHFNNLSTGLTKAVSPTSIGTIHANWGSLDSTKAIISYVPAYTVSSHYTTYWDNAAGDASDTFNVRFGGVEGATAGNNALRVRNPNDSMELLLALPTSKYKNITLKFATEKSSTTSGPGKQVFDYSTNGGTTWTTAGMSFPDDTFNNIIWNYVAINFANDGAVNNNANFIFRIRLKAPNTGTSGNARFDNITVEGDSIASPTQKLIHYWHFNNLSTGLTKAGSPSAIKPIHANWSSLDSTRALIIYVPFYTVSSNYKTYWDNSSGEASDTENVKLNGIKGAAAGNNYLRVRNPSDSMALVFYLPTTKYKNINIKYAMELSSSGIAGAAGGRELFDYSVDSGKTFRQNGLSITQDSLVNGTFNLVSVNLGADASVNNNSKFVFRIRTTEPNSGTSGNHRYDNFSVEGDSITPAVVFGKPLYKIRQVRPQDPTTGIADSLNKGKGYIKGVVISPNFTTSLQFSLADSTGNITVFASKIKYYAPSVGDSIIVHGTLTQFDGVTEYTADTIAKLTKGTWLPTAPVVTAMTETNESGLITINGVHIIDSTTWKPAGSGFNVNVVDNNKDTFAMRITSTIDLFKKGPIHGIFNVTGIETQFKSSSPYIGGYEIEPRSIADIVPVNFKPLYKIRQLKGQNSATGVADSVNKGKGYIKGVVISPNFTTSLQFSLADSTGNITIFSSKIKYYAPSVGDSILVHGTLTQFDGVDEYTADSIITLIKSTWLPTPTVTKVMNETLESGLIKINNVHIIDTTTWKPAGSGFNVNIVDNNNDTFAMRITSTIDLFKKGPIHGNFNVVGIETQFKTSSPYFGGYEIEPRSIADISSAIPSSFKPVYKISQVRPQNPTTGVADSLNKGKGYLKGVVMSPTFSTSYLQFSLVDSTGAITIYAPTVKNYTATVGDSLILHGTLTQFDGVTEYTTDTIVKLTNGTWLKTPDVVTTPGETEESNLITINNVHLIDTTQWVASGSGFNVTIVDNKKDTFSMRITSAIDLFKMHALKGNFNVTGIETQFKTASPYIGGYQIEPRGLYDIKLLPNAALLPLYKISQVRPQDPTTGVADSLNKGKGYIKGVVISPTFNTSYLQFSLVDNTGAITIFTSTVKYYTAAVGDSIMVHGTLTQFEGVTEYTADSIIKLNNGTYTRIPDVVTVLGESEESNLITIKSVHIIDSTQWLTGSSFNINITDNKDTFVMRVTSATNLSAQHAIRGYFNVTGIETQFQTTSPYFGGYEIEPRSISDIALIAAPPRITPLYTISQVRPQNSTTGVADSAGSKNNFFLKGVVIAQSFSATEEDFTIVDKTGGINIFNSKQVNGYVAAVGDSVQVRGLLSQFDGLTEVDVDSISKMNSGNKIPAATVISAMSEATESHLAQFRNAYLVDPTQWLPAGSGFNVNITDGKDTIQVRVSSVTDLFSKPAPRGRFNVTGISSQFKSSSPYIGGYQLLPRDIADIQPIPLKLYTISQVKPYNAITGIADSLNTFCWLKGVVESGNLSGSAAQLFSFEDNTGAITVVAPGTVNGYTPKTGDSIKLRGRVLQNNGLTVFGTDSIITMTGGTAIAPVTVTALNEATESELVKMQTYHLLSTANWDTATNVNGHFAVQATNGTDTITIVVSRGTSLYLNSARPAGYFDIVGIGSQNDPTLPYLRDYVLLPRSITDISHASGIAPENAAADIQIYPNPASEYLNIAAGFNISRITVMDMEGRTVAEQVPAAGTAKLFVGNLSKGIYILKIENGKNNYFQRIVKE